MGLFARLDVKRARRATRRVTRRARSQRLRAMTHPVFYAAQAAVAGFEPPASTEVEDVVAHYERVGRAAGARVGALFQPDWYRSRAAAAGLAVEGDPFEHFLEVGWDARVVPTPLYDEEWYVRSTPDVGRGEWGFEHYLRVGCYLKGSKAGPYAPNYGEHEPARAAQRHQPVLLTGMLHRAAEYDLRRTSWLEEGVAAGAAKLAGLEDPRVRDLVAKAAAIEPGILDEGPGRWVAWLPHLHPNAVTSTAAETVRRSLPVDRADAVVYFPDEGSHDDAHRVVAELRARGAETVVAVTTAHTAEPPTGLITADLRPHLVRLDRRQRLRVALDVLRGLAPRHAVAVDNVLGHRVIARHGQALQTEMTVAGRLEGRDLDLAAMVEIQTARDEQ